jgi:gamma-glutamyltranspeptidase / glutathione hydrolase
MEPAGVPAAIAAGHRATAAAGMEILQDDGTAADAAVAAVLSACVAETVMTGLAGGGHAIYWDAASARAQLIDCFVAIPGLGGGGGRGSWREVDIWFGAQPVPYAVGAGTCGVPGVPAGCELLWRRWGRMPWARVVEPALTLARTGVEMPPTHAAVLEMLAPVMTLDEGARIYTPHGQLVRGGERVRQPGLANLLGVLADEGAATFYRGTVADALLALMRDRGGLVTRADLEAYEAHCEQPAEGRYEGRRVLARRDLSDLLGTLARLPALRPLPAADRAVALAAALAGSGRQTGTSALAVVDPAGNACVAVTSLGLGTGDWLPGFDLHLNSMLGEVDLIRDDVGVGDRLASNMVPTLVFDDHGLEAAAGAAGGTRIRSATVQVLTGLLAEGLGPGEAVVRPRLHPLGNLVHVEPGVDDGSVRALEAAGWEVVRWRERHHYFGGVNLVARAGAAADPRRDGAALLL